MKIEEKIFTFFLLATVFFMFVLSFSLRAGSRTVPIVIGLCTMALMVILCLAAVFPRINSWYHKREAGDGQASLGEVTSKANDTRENAEKLKFIKKEISIVSWLLFVTVSTYMLGFMVGGPVFLFLFLKLWAKEGWVLSLNTTAAVFGVIYFIFVYILQIPLHGGVLFM